MVFAIFGVFALGAYLANGRAGRLGLVAMVVTVAANALFLPIGGVPTFASSEAGQAYLAGIEAYKELPASLAGTLQGATMLVSVVLAFVGNVLLGVAVWRSGILPKWAGAIWVVSALSFYVLGAVAGMLTTGASLPTQPVGGLLIAISGGWIAWSALRRPSAETG